MWICSTPWRLPGIEDRLAALIEVLAVVRMRLLVPVGLFVAVMAAGCGEEGAVVPEADDGVAPNLEMHDFMGWVLDPLADVIWSSAGTITTMEGVEDLAPTTQEGWDEVRNAAATIAELGNVLQIPAYSEGEDWNEYAQGLSRTAMLLIEAAQEKDDQKVFDHGGQLYNVCVACHQLYMLPEDDDDHDG